MLPLPSCRGIGPLEGTASRQDVDYPVSPLCCRGIGPLEGTARGMATISSRSRRESCRGIGPLEGTARHCGLISSCQHYGCRGIGPLEGTASLVIIKQARKLAKL